VRAVQVKRSAGAPQVKMEPDASSDSPAPKRRAPAPSVSTPPGESARVDAPAGRGAAKKRAANLPLARGAATLDASTAGAAAHGGKSAGPDGARAGEREAGAGKREREAEKRKNAARAVAEAHTTEAVARH